jgi:hypothetical protein
VFLYSPLPDHNSIVQLGGCHGILIVAVLVCQPGIVSAGECGAISLASDVIMVLSLVIISACKRWCFYVKLIRL